MNVLWVFSLLIKCIEKHTNHRHGIQLPQGGHSLEQQNNKASTFYSFDRASEEVGSYRLEVLQNTHSIRITENLMALFIISTK